MTRQIQPTLFVIRIMATDTIFPQQRSHCGFIRDQFLAVRYIILTQRERWIVQQSNDERSNFKICLHGKNDQLRPLIG